MPTRLCKGGSSRFQHFSKTDAVLCLVVCKGLKAGPLAVSVKVLKNRRKVLLLMTVLESL